MNSLTTQYRLEQPPAERAILPQILSGLDEMPVIEHDIEEITLPVSDWDTDVVTIIH